VQRLPPYLSSNSTSEEKMIMILITNIKENIKSRIKNTVVKFLQS
jgi:hypothetical protein